MAKKTIEERLAEIEQKKNRLQQKERALKYQLSQKERKARTKRLIETGAVVEKALDLEMTDELREKLLESLTEEFIDQNNNSYVFGKILKNLCIDCPIELERSKAYLKIDIDQQELDNALYLYMKIKDYIKDCTDNQLTKKEIDLILNFFTDQDTRGNYFKSIFKH